MSEMSNCEPLSVRFSEQIAPKALEGDKNNLGVIQDISRITNTELSRSPDVVDTFSSKNNLLMEIDLGTVTKFERSRSYSGSRIRL